MENNNREIKFRAISILEIPPNFWYYGNLITEPTHDIRVPPSEEWHLCRSVLSAIRALDMYYETIDEIMLDHDISHQVIVGKMSRPYPCEETFEAVARYIALLRECAPAWNPKITIHTSNPIGADAMIAILEEKGLKCTRQIAHGANRLEMQL